MVEKLKSMDLKKEQKEELWAFIKEEKSLLNKEMKNLETPTDNK